MPTIKITYSDSRYKPNAEVLASKLNLPLVDSAEISQQSAQNGQTDYYLEYASDGLCLKSAVRNEHGPIRCDFNNQGPGTKDQGPGTRDQA